MPHPLGLTPKESNYVVRVLCKERASAAHALSQAEYAQMHNLARECRDRIATLDKALAAIIAAP